MGGGGERTSLKSTNAVTSLLQSIIKLSLHHSGNSPSPDFHLQFFKSSMTNADMVIALPSLPK